MENFNSKREFFKRIYDKCIPFKHFFSFLILFTIGTEMLLLSWQKWPNILVDYGRELYVPWQINNGVVLYRDIVYFYGPLSSYLNAFLFKIFGTHLMTLAVFNISLIITLTLIIYRIFLITTDWLTATSASATFLAVFAFSQIMPWGNYNFVCPYTYNLTHGIFLNFLMIYFYLIYLTVKQKRQLFVMGVLLGLIFLTKFEVFIASAITMVVGIWLVMFSDKLTLSQALRILSYFCIGFFIPVFLFVVYFSCYMPFNKAAISIMYPYTVIFTSNVSSNIFLRHIMGTDDVSGNLLKMASAGLGYLAMFFDLALISFSLKRISRKNFFIFGTIIIFSLLFFVKLCWMIANPNIFRPLPVIMLALAVYLFILFLRFHHNLKEANRSMGLFVMTTFAFFLLLKMELNVHLYYYGFALAMPATLLLVGLFMFHMPILLAKDVMGRVFLRTICVALLGVFLITYMNISKHFYSLMTYPVGFGLDTIYDFDPSITTRGSQTQLAINEIEKVIKKNENFIVFPEGVMLNYLTKRVNPTPYLNFMATEMVMFGEQETLNSIIKSKTDYIILVDKDLSDFGCSFSDSSIGCGSSIFNWIIKNYSPVVKIGNMPFTGKGFGILICKRIIYPS